MTEAAKASSNRGLLLQRGSFYSETLPPPQGPGHLLRGEARQRPVLGEGGATPALAAARQSQEGVHRVRAHRHQHAAAAGRNMADTDPANANASSALTGSKLRL